MRQALLVAAFVMTGALGGLVPVLAQSPTQPSDPAQGSSSAQPSAAAPQPPDSSYSYDESVVVTASAIERDIHDVPASVTVIDAAEIAARQAVQVSDLVATAPGVVMVSSGPPGQVTSAFVRGTESDQVLLLWNGVELNDPYFGAVNWAFLPADGLDRVEVVRGPFSALYGGNAVGGVVQLFTGGRDGGTLRLEGGGNSYGRAGLAAGYSLGTVRFDVTGHRRRGDSELANGFFDSQEVVARLDWAPRDGVTVGLLTRLDDAETGIPFSGGQPSPERRIDWTEREVVVPVKVVAGDWSVQGQLSRVELDSGFRDPGDPFGFTASDTESQAERARAQASWQPNERVSVAFGSEIERLEVTSSSVFGVDLAAADQRTWALFSELSWAAGPVTLTAGARRDDNDVFGAETSLRAGAVMRLGDGWRLRASYGEAFRPPTLGELFFPSSGNPELAPERSEAFEIGLDWSSQASSGRGWRLGVTGFENRQVDLIDFDFVTFTNVNVGRARSRGIEATAAATAGKFDLRANLTYLDAEDRGSGQPLLRRPEWSANLVATLIPVEAWSLTVTGRFVGDRPDVDPVTFARAENESYLRFDLAAQWSLSQRFAPYARVENLADEQYAEALGFPAPGRTLIGGVAVSF